MAVRSTDYYFCFIFHMYKHVTNMQPFYKNKIEIMESKQGKRTLIYNNLAKVEMLKFLFKTVK